MIRYRGSALRTPTFCESRGISSVLRQALGFYGISGCGAVGSALRWGCRGRKFKSCHPDQQDREMIIGR